MDMDNIKDTLANATKTAYKATKGFLKSTKMSIDLQSEESKLRATYIEIGKKVHEIYTYGGSLGKFFDEKYRNILELEKKIDILRKDVDRVRGNKTCPKCAKVSSFTAEFCPKCGHNLDEIPLVPRTEEPEEIAIGAAAETITLNTNEPAAVQDSVQSEKICAVCNKNNPTENKFCFSCGRML